MQWVVLAYLLAVTTTLVIVGRLGDLLGRRRLMLAGFVVFVIGSAASAGASSLGALVTARAVQGLGAAVLMALSMALVGDAVPETRAGRAMGLLGTMSALGTALGPSLGGALVGWRGWPAIFQATAALGVIAAAVGARYLPRDVPQGRRIAFDLPGAALLAAALATYAMALTLPAGSSTGFRIALLAAALVLAGAFLVAESYSPSPLLQLGLLRQAGIGTGFATSALVNTVAMTTLVVGPFHLARALGLAPAVVGMVMAAGPLVAALAGVPAGRAVDRFGTWRAARLGLLLMGSGCLGFAVLPVAAGVPGYVLPLVATTAGFAIFQAANNTAVVTAVAATQRGVISALLTLSRNLGLVTGASAMGAVFLAATGAPELALADAAAVAEGTRTTFAAGALLVAIAFAATRQAPRPARIVSRAVPVAVLLLLPSPAARATEPLATPLPRAAAGGGPEPGDGRRAEELPDGTRLAWKAELRLRQVFWKQGQLRAVLAADWRPLPALRLFGELGTGQVAGRAAAAPANLRNDLSVQQLFVEARGRFASSRVGLLAGRQEFAEGPRQLVSLGDGPNLHRTWNGVRAYLRDRRWRLGAFGFRATRLRAGAFDDGVEAAETLKGFDAGFALGDQGASSVEPFWFRSTQPAHRVAGIVGRDERDSVGLRWWGRRGAVSFDATVVGQSGRTLRGRRVEAWGVFVGHSVALSGSGWKPRLTARLDLGSGGDAWNGGVVRTFHPLYASSSYVSEGQLLALGNLFLVAPGVVVSPLPRITLSLDVGLARRTAGDDAVYATAGRAYAGTRDAAGRHVGELWRLGAAWAPRADIAVRFAVEHLRAGALLRRAGHHSASHAFLEFTLRP